MRVYNLIRLPKLHLSPMSPTSLALSFLLGLPFALGDFYYPNPTHHTLSNHLISSIGQFSSGFILAITPCSNYVSGSQLLGRQTSAQWIRVAFHDFVTANVSAGTGGIDASIGFETLRPEDSGSAMNDSIGFFSNYVTPYVSSRSFLSLVPPGLSMSFLPS
jgi:hypothetical protein